MKRPTTLLFLISAVLTVSPCSAQTNSIIVPKVAADSFGDRFGALFSFADFAQVYGSAEFADANANVLAITAIAFRWDEAQTQAVIATVPHILLSMGTSAYVGPSFIDLVRQVTPVFEAQNLQVTLSGTRSTSDFALVFPLRNPFVYDLRKGRLVLEGIANPVVPQVDAQSEGDGPSVLILSDSKIGSPDGAPEVMVTKFFFTVVPSIDSIQHTGGKIQIDFTAPQGAVAQVEGATTVTGAFAVEQDVTTSVLGPNKKRAILPISDDQHFYRVRIQ